jgi:predicted O-methyltransferase YrrM
MKHLIKQVTPPFLLEIGKSIFRRAPPAKPEPPAMRSAPVFTNDWFANVQDSWDVLLTSLKPTKILEVGSFEGASVRYLIERLANEAAIEIHCIDSWEGGIEHQPGGFVESEMSSVEQRFHHNTRLAIQSAAKDVALVVHKAYSDVLLPRLLAEGKAGYFDFIYIDGSHQAPDVLFDAVVAFKLLRIGGTMAFDDYLWSEDLPTGIDLLRCPKPAIDAFVNLHARKLKVLPAPLRQLYVQKVGS